jgi:glycosyltransferase involved in cell wall biosynthesis
MSRVVMFVYNDVSRDSRVLKEAASLAAAGYDVRVVGRWNGPAAGMARREMADGFEIVRVPGPEFSDSLLAMALTAPRAPVLAAKRFASRLADRVRDFPAGLPDAIRLLLGGILLAPLVAIGLVLYVLRGGRRGPGSGSVALAVRWLAIVAGWAREAAHEAGRADVYHGHDLTGLPAAVRARAKWGGRLVYDSHELFLEAGIVATVGLARKAMRRLEARWVRSADAVITVNQSIADELAQRYRPRRILILHNVPPRWDPEGPRENLLRQAAHIPADAFVALYHGGFQATRGLEQIAEAILQPGLEAVHLVYMGHGLLHDQLRAMTAEPRFGGRIHVLDSVPPSQLLRWVASADLGLALTQPTTLNNRLSSPNKMFETIATGTPIVMSDFPEMRRVVLEDPAGPLGALCDPSDPVAIGRAIREIVELSPSERAALRARCLEAAHERWNWERESAGLLDLYGSLTAQP